MEGQSKKVLILGSQGMAGHVISQHFHLEGYEVIGVARCIHREVDWNTIQLDVTQWKDLFELIKLQKPHFVVNAVGALIQDSLNNYESSLQLNGILPQKLAKWSNELSYKLVLISTDCVFDGSRGGYSDTDTPNSFDNYGLSKRIGEVSHMTNVLTIRTSIIGPELKDGSGLWNWFLNQDGLINGFTNVFWSGVTTLQLSRTILTLINEKVHGIYNLSNGIPISKYRLLLLLNKFLQKGISIQPVEFKPSNKTLIPTKGIDLSVPSYEEMIQDQIDFSQKYFD